MEHTQTMKLHIHVDESTDCLFREMTTCYSDACNFISEWVFSNGFPLNFMKIQDKLYQTIRDDFGLKSQLTISSFKTVTARYKTLKTQLSESPFKHEGENGKWQYIPRTLEWLENPVRFSRPQADLVKGRDYSFVDGGNALSINTLGKRVKVTFDRPEYFEQYFSGSWSFGTAKLVSLLGEWYLHIPMTRNIDESVDVSKPKHVVGIDRGLRFLAVTYDESGKCRFYDGKEIMHRRDMFAEVRAELQAKGTKSAKRALKRISGRENRWMSDVNHCLSKTLVSEYGEGTLFAIEDLAGVSFSKENLNSRSKSQRRQTRSWAFYELEQQLTYKARAAGSAVLKVPADYTSQRCPKCGRIHKENRHHDTHEYICDSCGYRSNDDRVGAMNLYELGKMYVSGDAHPRFGKRKE